MTQVIRPIFETPTEKRMAAKTIRPRDAATLVLLDTAGRAPRVLMGRRKASLAFMPGLHVFPGGRVDRADGRMPVAADLSAATQAKMALRSVRPTPTRHRALALAAIRETYEEAGVLIGVPGAAPAKIPSPAWQPFHSHGVTPDLSGLVYFARAITPPGRPRRFDTRFFLAETSSVAVTLPPEQCPDTDLEALEWLDLATARERPLPFITTLILKDLEARLALPDWRDPAAPIPFYFSRGETQLRDDI